MLMDESDRASAASTMDLAASLVAFMYGLFAGVPRGQEQGPEIQDDGPTAEADTHKRAAPRPAYTPFERTHSSLHSVTHDEPRPITVAQWSLPVFTSWMHERNRAPALY